MLDRPWARVKNPTAIPDPLDVDVLRAMGSEAFASLLRDNLVPREQTPTARALWEGLWDALAADDELADRAYGTLETFLDITEADLAAGDLDDHARRRAEKFARFCNEAWKRLEFDSQQPLAWTGRAARRFNPAARRVIEQLVLAIERHRAEVPAADARPADVQLWLALHELGLQPPQHGRHGRG